jgi:hypothetical protein
MNSHRMMLSKRLMAIVRKFLFLTSFLPTVMVTGEDLPVTHTELVAIPGIARPDYLKPMLDPVFKSTVTRITGDVGTEIPGFSGNWNAVARHTYSKYSAWNCDQTLIFLGVHHGFPSMLFLDGTSYQPVFGRNAGPGSETRWHATDPDSMVYVNNLEIGLWNVRTDKTQVIATFPGYSDFKIGPWEGNLSLDGSRIAINAQKGGARVAFAYDIEKKQKYPDLALDMPRVDWVSISASGKYIVINGTIQGNLPDGKHGASDRTQVYDLEGNKVGSLWSDYGRPSHYDLTLDDQGEDIAVGVAASQPDDGRVIKRRLRDGLITVLTPGGYAGHTSTRNVKRPGWAYTTYQYRGPDWKPYWDEVVAVKLDGSLTVERIAHMHAKDSDYLAQAQAVPSPDGERVLWASNWNAESGRPVATYVAKKLATQHPHSVKK